jgi:hypothetical protein
VQFQPILALPAGTGAQCPALPQRSNVQQCAAAAPCTGCTDLAQDGAESDVDCGGNWESPIPATANDQQSVDAMLDGSAPGQAKAGTTPCARCGVGRACASNGDCDATGGKATGLVCIHPGGRAQGVCAPAALYATPISVDVNFTLPGAS